MRLAAVFCLGFILFSCTTQEKSNPKLTAHENPYPIVWPEGVIEPKIEHMKQEYPASNLIDRTWRSWSGGPYFTFVLEKKAVVAGFALKNGFSNFDLYKQYDRVKSLKIFADGEYLETIEIKDSMSFEQYSFRQPVNCITIRFVIEDIYPGTVPWNGAHISEVTLFSRPVSDGELYENIIGWLDMQLHDAQISFVSDADKLSLRYYIPFALPYFGGTLETEIALLDEQSTLKLRDNLPRLDGATAMYPLYSAFVHAVYPEIIPDLSNPDKYYSLLAWEYLPHISAFWENIRKEFTSQFKSIVQCNTTPNAYQRLIDGETDIIFCYEPSQEQINAAAAKGLRFNMTPIAKDAFVFIVNEKNVLNNITQQQIKDIYSGRVTNWKSISGADEPIIAYQRAENGTGKKNRLHAGALKILSAKDTAICQIIFLFKACLP
jgi:hypothetical protein